MVKQDDNREPRCDERVGMTEEELKEIESRCAIDETGFYLPLLIKEVRRLKQELYGGHAD